MKTNLYKSFFLALACVCGASLFVLADAVKSPAGIAGGVVEDASVTVAPGAYTSFSTVSGGKRYYLGVDTMAAKTGTYQLAAYDKPCFATIWQVGQLYSYTGEVLPEKNYQRTVKSVYLAEKYPAGDKFLAVGTDHSTWSEMGLVRDSVDATLWFTQKDDVATGKYIQGFLYYSYEQASLTVYRYLTYSDLYAFNRAYSSRPAVSQRVSIWSRTTGDQMSCYFMPGDIEFGYNRDSEGETKNFAFRMRLELDGDCFRSQFDGAEFYAKEPTVIEDQNVLRNAPYNVTYVMDWSSTHNTPAKRDTSIAHWPGEESTTIDTTMITLLPATPAVLSTANNRWEDDMKTIGASPKNVHDVTQDHVDYLHIHMTYDGHQFDDSTRVTRRLYEDHPHTTLNMKPTPEGYAFPYRTATQNTTFTLSAKYQDGNEVAALNGAVVSRSIGETEVLDLTQIRGYRDTIWVYDGDGNLVIEDDKPVYSGVRLLDTLLISAYLSDGVTSAIGSGSGQWIQSVNLSARNQIRITAKAYNADATDIRAAMIKYSYTYRHSSMKGDTVRAEGVIWVTQDPSSSPAHGLIDFSHQTGKGDTEYGSNGFQRVPELIYTTYIIPNEPLPLPIHRDHWGYYRWYNYDATNRDKDISQNWGIAETPKNYAEGEFNPLDMYNSTYSHGRFDMRSHFRSGVATNTPAVQHKTGDAVLTKSDLLACDVSIYTDTLAVGTLENSTLSALTEPTLGYRQIFNIRPAKEMADRMEQSRKNGTNDTLQKMTVIAPYGRRYHITPESPYKITDGQIEEGHMQYVYYYNPNEENNTDPNMGSKSGWNDTKLQNGANYHRIGLSAKTTGYITYSARMLTASEVLAMDPGSTKQVIMVNPRKSTGYIMGKRSGSSDCAIYDSNWGNITTEAQLKKRIEDNLLNPTPQSNYVLTLRKGDDGKYTLENDKETLHSNADVNWLLIIPYPTFTVEWKNGRFGSDQWEISDFTACSDGALISNTTTGLLKIHEQHSGSWGLYNLSRNGYLTACDVTTGWFGRISYDREPNVINENEQGTGSASNQGWIFYEIEVEDHLIRHEEHPKWYRKKIGETWVPEDNASWTSVDVRPDGTMTATYSTTTDPYVDYKLESEHFNLARARVYLRDPEKEGPSTKAIISEDSIDNHYTLVASLGTERIPAPGTSDLVTPYYHLQWNHTQFSYHYPVGTGEHEIPASKRVSGEDRMPAKGEYITTNKFEKAGHYAMESCAGAEHGYMFCYNRAARPLVFLDFTMDQPACTDEELTLVANFANPSSNAPHVTAKMYGKINPTDPDWTLIYTYLTGELEQSDKWYQVVLPLAKDTINKYKTFRCVGTVSGTDDNSDAFLLFDRMRLLSKDRPLTSYQKRTTCENVHDSIYIISRIDYKSSELASGSIICYQYQRWDNSANGGAGGYVPMLASQDNGNGTYTRLSATETDVYPGYYKVGMSAAESVEKPAFKTSVLRADYGTIVVPENNYDPSRSNTAEGRSPVRKAAIDKIATILGDDRSSYYDETGRIMPYSDITTAETFDFGSYNAPRCKFYVNEGTVENPHWVMYLINRVSADDTDNGTFRLAMNYVDEVDNQPNFSESKCSTERIIVVKHPVAAKVDDKIVGDTWHNYDRAHLSDPAYAGDEFLPANTVHTLSMRFTPPAGYKNGTENRAECRFDLVRAFDFMKDYMSMTPEQQAAADAQWEDIYHCTVGDFQRAMEMFREPGDEDTPNPNCKVYRWNDVSKDGFQWNGTSKVKADSAYNLLNRLVEERLLEIGLSTREIYIGNNQNIYFYIRPIAASGSYIVAAHDGTDSVAEASVCNTPIWVELHSTEVPQELRLGYDKKFGDSYMIPVVRASAAVANSELPVRISEITHDLETNTGITLGWDSTRVVETNDPAWKSTSSFRYTQDKILQGDIYANYYKKGDIIRFRPVDAAHVTALRATDCDCYDYDPTGTTYDIEHPRNHGASGTNAVVMPETPLRDCNQWHKQAQKTGSDETRQPGYQVANNFTLHAGYWYKFRTSFFTKPDVLLGYESNASAGLPLGYSYFILAIAPDTAIWAPSHDEGENLWNDDDNWTAIVNGEPFHEAIARVPMEETNVIIGRPAVENQVPVVNNTLPGDIEKGEVDFGFKTATCRDILFRPLSKIYGQELLDYNRAFVDVRFQEGTWRTFSPAIKDVYSGDMYVPVDSAADMASYFAPLRFDSSPFSASHNRAWPYLFYQSWYNQTVRHAFQNTDKDGNPVDYREKSSAEWQQTNVLDESMTPGKVSAVIAWGPEGNTRDIIVRLPKQESVYHYVSMDGTVDPTEIKLGRTAFDEINHNLAFDKTALGGANYKDYTLANQTPAKLFWFGNATMELIDVYRFCLDNADKLEGDGTSFVVYELTGESAYAVYVLTPNTVRAHNFYLAPMRAIGIMAKEATTSLTLRLNTHALIPMPGSMEPVQDITPAPARRMRTFEETYSATLYISATASADGEKYKAYITLAENNSAHDEFVGGEDAECIVSQNMADFTFHTPLTMYTICENKTLMYDSRSLLGRIPLGFAMQSEYSFDDRIVLSFATEGKWDRPLYLYDALTNDSIMILNGMRVTIAAPQTDEIRYYINGAANTSSSDDHSGTPTGIEIVNEPNDQVPNDQMGNDQMVHIYDVLGRHVMTLVPNDLIYNVKLPTGVYIISRGNKTERMVIK